MKKIVTQAELNERSKRSREKEELLTIIVEPGTKDRIKEQGFRVSTYVRKLIEEDLRKRESN